MLCDICHEKESTVFYTVIVNNQKTELHLCDDCAQKKGLIKPSSLFDLKEFIPLIPHEPEVEELKCPRCGLSYREFRETTKFGCADCYKTFEKKISSLLRRIHGSTQHIGKTIGAEPDEYKKDNRIHELRSRLKKAVENESYEEAARIRDEIRKIKNSKW